MTPGCSPFEKNDTAADSFSYVSIMSADAEVYLDIRWNVSFLSDVTDRLRYDAFASYGPLSMFSASAMAAHCPVTFSRSAYMDTRVIVYFLPSVSSVPVLTVTWLTPFFLYSGLSENISSYIRVSALSVSSIILKCSPASSIPFRRIVTNRFDSIFRAMPANTLWPGLSLYVSA